LEAYANALAASAARISVAAIDPEALAGTGLIRGAAVLAAIGDDHVACVFEHIGRDQLF
jgi:hypothetical protein